MYERIVEEQKRVCQRYGFPWIPTAGDQNVGLADAVRTGGIPINGLRIGPAGLSCGWFLWVGEMTQDPDFFKPVHARHLADIRPVLLKYLGLPPGCRIQVDDQGYEDVWLDDESG